MFSTENRCIYENNQLGEVICQLRFPEILTIAANLPVAFQDAIRSEYPQYSVKKELGVPKLTGTPGNLSFQKPVPVTNHQFSSPDGYWRINLTTKFISLTCSHYTRWEEFAQMLDRPLASFIQIYQPAYFERIGLRYLNFFSRHALSLEGVPFSHLFQPNYLGILGEADIQENQTNRSSVDAELTLRSGCKLKVHAGPGVVKKNGQMDPEVKFIFDQDLFQPEHTSINHATAVLQMLHTHADSVFRGAITPQLHQAMEPETP